MQKKWKERVLPCLLGGILLGTGICITFMPKEKYSQSERRALTRMPEISKKEVVSGKFQKTFEAYLMDQFPQRDKFRSVKAIVSQKILQKKDNHELYEADGYLAKMEYPVKEKMLDYATERFQYIYQKYLEKKRITPYLVVVPDKNYFMAGKYGYLSMDYGYCVDYIEKKTEYMKRIDVADCLELSDYYKTDTHWKQEKLVKVAEKIGATMGLEIENRYEIKKTEYPFYGVYYGQVALPVGSDEICYLTNDELTKCIVTDYNTGIAKKAKLYNLEKAEGKDPYEMFLEGATPLVTIENPNAKTKKELVMFRDSFGSSIAPLFAHNYAKITLVDIRYLSSDMVEAFVSFENVDVLFLYSTLLLNNSLGLR